MPGHLKKSDGPDPDPSPWLIVSYDLKQKLKAKPYDPKKSCWVPDKATHGYFEGLIDSTDGDKVTVTILETKEVSTEYAFIISMESLRLEKQRTPKRLLPISLVLALRARGRRVNLVC